LPTGGGGGGEGRGWTREMTRGMRSPRATARMCIHIRNKDQ
jgi:hypothetical protein